MSFDLSKIRRYELKYTVTEDTAAQICDYIRGFCALDENVPKGENGYVVNNLYFDTDDLKFYYDTKHRKLSRYKPRARYYGNTATNYVWPEIKYRHANIIWKTRHKVAVEKWPDLFYPQRMDEKSIVYKERIDSFESLIYWYNAHPVIHVRYFREPYVTQIEEYGRVTFDRQLCYRQTFRSNDLDYNEKDMIYYDDPVTTKNSESLVLLEIKVETMVPYWAIELIRKFDLIQRPFSKYCYGIDYILNYHSLSRMSVF